MNKKLFLIQNNLKHSVSACGKVLHEEMQAERQGIIMNKPEKTNQNLSGVKCDVKECYYNSLDCGCQAAKIHVSTCQTCDGVKTDCATFTQK